MRLRPIILLLLALNAGVGLWWLLRSGPRPPAPPAQPAGVPRLQLLSERGGRAPPAPVRAQARVSPSTPPAAAAPSADAPVPVPEAEAPSAAEPPALACLRLGPFRDAAAAEAARARLPATVRGIGTQREPGRAAGPWNVSLPPQADRAAADALAARIDAAGFKDYYVVSGGEQANAIALGRFGGEEAARRHQAALQAAGFQAQVQGPAETGERVWLQVRAPASLEPAALRAAAGAQRSAPCASGGAAPLR